MTVDLRLMEWIADHRSAPLTAIARTLMAGSDGRVLGVVLIVVFALAIAVEQVAALGATITAAATASAVATALKDLVDRPRPPADLALVTAQGSSMPSTVAALLCAGTIALVLTFRWPSPLVRRVMAGLVGCLALLVSAAMLYLGAHWLTDVLAGWLIGATVASAAVALFARITGAHIAL